MSEINHWSHTVDEKNILQEYPRMQFQRDSYFNMNGVWEYQITGLKEEPKTDHWKKILVPFAVGSKLSGVEEVLQPNQVLWYRKQFAYKPGKGKTLLNFEAVDQKCTVYINGIEVGSHMGGYDPFTLDISSAIKYQNSIMVRCVDDSDKSFYAYGRQRLEHEGMWYKPTAGIWQTVWIEDIPERAIEELKITPNYDKQSVHIDLKGDFDQVAVIVSADGEVVYRGITKEKHYDIPIENMHPWTLEDPFLYDLYIQTEEDIVKSYFAMRKFSAGNDADGTIRFCLNDKPIFLSGLLDQGYNSDGWMTYPSDENIQWELQRVKDLGFNMLRKHVKVESRRWYYHCDRLGILVMQDMPSGGTYNYNAMAFWPNLGFRKMKDIDNPKLGRDNEDEKKIYYIELNALLKTHYNTPCIFAWVPFNEGWGQFDSEKITDYIRKVDPTRLIDSASGWHDQGCGDFASYHSYSFPYHTKKDKHDRIVILSGFGGYSFKEAGHLEANKPYGYKIFTDKLALSEGIHKVYEEKVFRNISEGLAGCVYTQLSDVEDECNGLFTMDREVLKIEERRIRKMNEKCMRRLPK